MTGDKALRERSHLLDELRQIVQSMKNLAFAELQRVSRIREAQSEAASTLNQALMRLGSMPSPASSAAPDQGRMWLVIGAERGFCGAFNARLADTLDELKLAESKQPVLVASTRMKESSPSPAFAFLKGCASSDEVDMTVDDWLAAIEQNRGSATHLQVIRHDEHQVIQTMLPLHAPPCADRVSIAHQLPLPGLRSAIHRQHLRFMIQDAITASLLQENHWRLNQMQRAQDHLDELSAQLRRQYAANRQANITNELETLMSGPFSV